MQPTLGSKKKLQIFLINDKSNSAYVIVLDGRVDPRFKVQTSRDRHLDNVNEAAPSRVSSCVFLPCSRQTYKHGCRTATQTRDDSDSSGSQTTRQRRGAHIHTYLLLSLAADRIERIDK